MTLKKLQQLQGKMSASQEDPPSFFGTVHLISSKVFKKNKSSSIYKKHVLSERHLQWIVYNFILTDSV